MNMTKEEYKKFLENLTDEEFNASIQRVSEAEFDQENPNFDQDQAILKAERQRRTRSKNKANPMGKKDGGIIRMSNGGPVPSKYKGFSKLPEPVQEKIDPSLATKYNVGGMVKKNKSKNNYRGQYDIQTKKVKFKGVY